MEEAADGADVQAFERTLVEAFPVPSLAPLLPGCLLDDRVLGTPLRLWVGREDGRPVAVALAHVSHGVVLIEMVATRPECRGRGYGAAVTAYATNADPSLPAVLLASDDGRPVYEHMGYVALLRFTLWFRP